MLGNTAVKLKITAGPYIKRSLMIPQIMRTVLYAAIPICAFSFYLFGLSIVFLILTAVFVCLATEEFWNKIQGKTMTITDGSAAVTGVLLALTLPPGFPLWMTAVAGCFAISFGKIAFGGLGHNIFNPALMGRIFAQSAFPVAMTTWVPPFALHRFTEMVPTTYTRIFAIPGADVFQNWLGSIQVDGFTGATPLTLFKFQHIASDPYAMATGFTSGSTGETCAILIVLCGLYLCWRKIADWRIPLSVISGALIIGMIFYLANAQTYPDPLFILTSGGLLFGAFFMATDPVGAPITPLGRIIFGLFIGFIVMMIRLFGSWPEGVMCAILWGNAMSPIIDRITRSKPFGTARSTK